MTRACDLIVSGGLLFLLLFTPFAFGAVHPWAYMTMESVVFLLVAAACARCTYLRGTPMQLGLPISRLAIPFGLFLSLICGQLAPLPPALLHFFSPETYRLYQTSLPGWPDQQAYVDLLETTPQRSSQPRLLPTVEQARQADAATNPEKQVQAGAKVVGLNSLAALSKVIPWSWRPLSVAPTLTFTDLLKFLAYGGLFFLVWLYPFGDHQSALGRSEIFSLRRMLLAWLVCASLVALIGIMQLVAGNGKVLWHFVPYDWDGQATDALQRASGPFVNPDHFANYLALILPFTLALAVKPRGWFAARSSTVRLYCGAAAGIIVMAIILSLSRFGWISALISLVMATALSRMSRQGEKINFFQRRRIIKSSCAAAALLTGLILIAWLIGPQARHAIDNRLSDGFRGDGTIATRLSVWRDTLSIVSDFPLLGSGLGTWADIFPRYQRASAVESFFRETHNDFLELLAETGVIGFLLLAIFFYRCGRVIIAGFTAAADQVRVILLPSLTALAIMLGQEFFDFSLQIPANALLFTVVLAISMRIATQVLPPQPKRDVANKSWLPVSGIAIAAVLSGLTWTQSWLPYPYNLRAPSNSAEAAELIDAHPAQANGHRMMAMLQADRGPLSRQIDEFATAVRLQPNDPRLRDLYASALLRANHRAQGLQEISRSVALVPTLERHFYLHEKLLPFLDGDERKAIEAGFHQAIASGNATAQDGLARFYKHSGQPLAQAKLLESRAAGSNDAAEKSELTLQAGQSYAAAGELKKAEELFKSTIAARRQDPRPYQALALKIYAGEGNVPSINAIIAEGLANRADPVTLYLAQAEALNVTGRRELADAALAQAAQAVNQAAARGADILAQSLALAESARRLRLAEREQSALELAMEMRPNDKDILYRLGQLYSLAGRHDRAVYVFTRLSRLTPDWAPAFLQLGRAEEARYGFAQADKAYARAAALAPGNPDYSRHYDSFKARLAHTSAAAAEPRQRQ